MSQNINTIDISNDANLEDYVLVSVNGSLRRVKVADLKELVDSTEDIVVVDTKLSTTSVNPVQNRVITAELNKKANSSDMPTYQTKIDNTLTTTSKEVVGAINENAASISQLSEEKADKSEVSELKEDLIKIDKRTYCRISSNMIDMDTASDRGIWWYNGVKYSYGDGNNETKCTKSFRVDLKPNTKYFCQSFDVVNNAWNKQLLYLNVFSEDGELLEGGSSKNDFTTASNASYAMLTYRIYSDVDSNEVRYLPYLSEIDYKEFIDYEEYEEVNAEYLVNEINELKSTQLLKASLKTPSQYELVVGDTFELFYKGIVDAINADLFHIEIECSKGNPYKKRFIFTPTTENVGTIPMTIKLYDLQYNLLDTKIVNLVIKPKATSPATERVVLYVADSLGSNGYVADEFNRRLVGNGGSPIADNMNNISFIGNCESVTNGVKYEGYGGWTFNTYNNESKSSAFMWITTNHDKTSDDQHSTYKDSNNIIWKLETIEDNRIKLIRTSASGTLPSSGTLTWSADGVHHTDIVYTSSEQASGNPFWNESVSKVDFANYVSNQGKTSLDYVYVLLGWNSYGIPIYTYKQQVKTFIDNVLASFPNCKIVLLGLEIPSQDGLASNYGASGSYSNYHNLMNYVWALNELYTIISDEYDNVSFINICGQFDTENNMSTGTRPVNTRNSKTETYQTNGLHPTQNGYYQIADSCYRDFVHKLQS